MDGQGVNEIVCMCLWVGKGLKICTTISQMLMMHMTSKKKMIGTKLYLLL